MNIMKISPAVNAGAQEGFKQVSRRFKEEIMPHVIVEYSANIEADIPPQRLVEEIHQAAITSGIAEPVAVRTRLKRREHYRVGDGSPEDAVVHIDIRGRQGRMLEQREA